VNQSTFLLALTASGIANIIATALLIAGAGVIHRQGTRLVRLTKGVADLTEENHALRDELGNHAAEIHRLDELVPSWVTGEAS
jgi:hypothetical protein